MRALLHIGRRNLARLGGAIAVGLAGLACLLTFGCGDEPTSGPAAPAAADKAGRGSPGNWVTNPMSYASGLRVGALAVTPARVLASTLGPSATKLVELGEDGSARPFAPEFTAPAASICLLEVATGEARWTPADVFVSRGTEIWQMAAGTTAPALFASLPLADDDIAGLCFDHAGLFDFDLLALTTQGSVYRIDERGRWRAFGSVGPGGGGISVTSMHFTTAPGMLLVAFPDVSEVRSIDVAGNVQLLLRWPGVTGTASMPDLPVSFARTGGAFFIATDGGMVYRYPYADLMGFAGQLVLTTRLRSGSGLITPVGSGFRMRSFSRFLGAEIACGFARRPVVTPVQVDILPNSPDNTIVLGATTLVPVGLMATPDFSPTALNGGEITLASAEPVRRGVQAGTFTDLNHDGLFDLLLQFRVSEMQLEIGTTNQVLEGTTIASERVRGSDRLTVRLP